MARMKSNALVEGLSGKVGNIVIKQYGSRTVITSVPDRSKVKLSTSQKKANQRFQEAVAYARAVLKDPRKRKAYEEKLEPGKTVYHAALAEFLREGR